MMSANNNYQNQSYQEPSANYQPPPTSNGMAVVPPSSAQPSTSNPFAAEYLNTVKENRSVYGNYLDNSYTYDPHKDKKSHFNTVYETDAYNPWGKPGGGAPKLDGVGHVKTKIVGTLKWNLNGETEDDRMKRMTNGQRMAASPTKNTLMYRKLPQPQLSASGATPRVDNNNNSYREPMFNPGQQFGSQSMQDLSMSASYPPPPSNRQQAPIVQTSAQPSPPYMPQQQFQYPPSATAGNAAAMLPPITQVEREAHIRNFERMNSNSLNGFGANSSFNNIGSAASSTSHKMAGLRSKNEHELNRISNKLYNDNGPSDKNPNSPFWFGRTGTYNSTSLSSFNNNSASFVDVRRRKLLDALENRQPTTQNKFATSMSNEYLPNSASNTTMYVYPGSSSTSNHRNRYENPIQQN